MPVVAEFILGILYILKNPYFPEGDQIGVAAFAAYAREGNYVMLGPGGYVGMYQQQKGLGHCMRFCSPFSATLTILQRRLYM